VPPELVDPVPQLTAARVTIVAGKGGVGKTTVTAVLARAAAAAGLRVLARRADDRCSIRSRAYPVHPSSSHAPATRNATAIAIAAGMLAFWALRWVSP